jgi:hypothetical protein
MLKKTKKQKTKKIKKLKKKKVTTLVTCQIDTSLIGRVNLTSC